MKSNNLNKANTRKYKQNKLSRIKEKITLLDSNISELYKIYALTKKERVDKEKNEKIIINRINYLTDEEKKLRLKCEIQMKKIKLLSKNLSKSKILENQDYFDKFSLEPNFDIIENTNHNRSYILESKNNLINTEKIKEIKNFSSNNNLKKNHNKSEEKNLNSIKFNLNDELEDKSNIAEGNNNSDEKKEKDLFINKIDIKEKSVYPDLYKNRKNKLNKSVIFDKPKMLSIGDINNLKKEKGKISQESLIIKNHKPKKYARNLNKQRNIDRNFFQNKTIGSNLNKSIEEIKKINLKNQLIDPNKNDEKIDSNIRKIKILKKKIFNDNNDNNNHNNLEQTNNNKITYDFIINDDNIYYNNKKDNKNNNNSNLLNNNKIIDKNYIFKKNEEKFKNIIANNNKHKNESLKKTDPKSVKNKKIIKNKIDNNEVNLKKNLLAKKLEQNFKLIEK